MKKISIGIILFCFVITCHAQSLYSKKNLENTSQEDLNQYLKQAKGLRTAGIILTAIGPVTYGTIMMLANNGSDMSLDTAGLLLALGTISTLAGIPILITGSSRVNRIKNALSNKVSVDLSPCIFQNNLALTHQTGVTLRIRF